MTQELNKPSPERIERAAGIIVTESRKGGAYGFAHISALGIASSVLAADDSHLAAENERLRKLLGEAEGALIWCSGSQDFSVGGQAEIGWEKLCRPLLTKIRAERER